MTQQHKIICIFGGSGFLGRHITQDLARAGYRIKIATRIPESAYELKTYGAVGQIVPYACNYNDPESIRDAIKGCDGVINLVGILFETRKNKFSRVHADLPKIIAEISREENVEKFIHLSALGVDKSQSKYAASKLLGEENVKYAYPVTTILRPSVVFGPDDNFFNMFAKLACVMPFLPLIGGGKTKFQPVYVGDIAAAVKNILMEKTDQYLGQTYELGGPEIVTFKQIYKRLLNEINRNKKLISLPWAAAYMQGALFSLMPKPLLTVDQVRSLKTDNVVNEDALTLSDLGIDATAMGSILPQYLRCYRRGGPFSDKKTA